MVMPKSPPDMRRVETVLGNLLRVGSATSLILIAVGLAVTLTHHPDFLSDPAALGQVTDPQTALPHSLTEVGRELLQLRGRAIIMFGLLLLIMTPIARVAVSAVAYVREKDWRFAAITAFVLLVLTVSFLVGAVD